MNIMVSPTTGALVLVLFVMVGVAVYYFRIRGEGVGSKKTVLLLRPRDKRGVEIPVIKETDRILECAKVGGISRRYLKNGPGWTFKNKTMFLAEEGIAYTAIVKGKNATMRLSEAIKTLLGDYYAKLPEPQRKILENPSFGVTVDIQGKPEDADLPSLSPEAVNDSRYEVVLNFLVKSLKAKGKRDWMPIIAGFAVGAIITYLAANQGWIRIVR